MIASSDDRGHHTVWSLPRIPAAFPGGVRTGVRQRGICGAATESFARTWAPGFVPLPNYEVYCHPDNVH